MSTAARDDLWIDFIEDGLVGLRGRDPDPTDTTPTKTWATPGDLARDLDPTTRQTPALDAIDAALVDVDAGRCERLIITMPPQEGKTTRVKVGVLWMMLRNKRRRIVAISYGKDLAVEFGRDVRSWITSSTGVEGGLNLGVRVARDNGSVSSWTLDGHRGGLRSVGLGGGITGRPADCVSGDTYIECERGRLTAREAFDQGIARLLAYDHATGRAVWRNVDAARRIRGRRVVEVVTESGRTLTCTPDHRVYTSRGYVPAGDLRPGDSLVAVVGARRVPMREPARCSEDGRPEGDPTWAEPLLLGAMPTGRAVRAAAEELLPVLWRANPAEPQGDMFRGVRSADASGKARAARMPAMFEHVPASVVSHDVLHTRLRERGALGADGGQGQLALQDRHQLRPVVSVDATADPRTGRRPLRRVLGVPDVDLRAQGADGHTIVAADSPHRRGRQEQHPGEPDHPVHGVPRGTSQVESDTVAMVRSRGDETIDVYDFQVEDAHNFFANGVLVHNCMVIDDPIKNREEADSEVYRAKIQRYWTGTLSTRLAPGAPVIVILTRWHEDDLAGWLLKRPDGHRWRVLNIPAQADHDPNVGETDPLGREPGEYMLSARIDERTGQPRTVEDWEQIKVQAGSQDWEALYQGNPSPPEGNMISRTWWKYYQVPPWLEQPDGSRILSSFDDLLMSWDLTFKDTKDSDYVVGQVWMRSSADHYLLDQVRGRWAFPETCRQIVALAARWPQALLKLVEDKANGPAVMAALRNTVPGLVPEEPQGSKIARLSAVSPLIEAGNVWLPDPERIDAPWVGGYVDELAAFPTGRHDDQVDATSQALNRLRWQPLTTASRAVELDEYRLVDTRGYYGSPV